MTLQHNKSYASWAIVSSPCVWVMLMFSTFNNKLFLLCISSNIKTIWYHDPSLVLGKIFWGYKFTDGYYYSAPRGGCLGTNLTWVTISCGGHDLYATILSTGLWPLILVPSQEKNLITCSSAQFIAEGWCTRSCSDARVRDSYRHIGSLEVSLTTYK